MKKILIWKCRKCGLEARSLTLQDEEKHPDGERNFTCNECILKEWEERKKIENRQGLLFH